MIKEIYGITRINETGAFKTIYNKINEEVGACYSHHNKVSQTEQLKQQNFILSQFKRLV